MERTDIKILLKNLDSPDNIKKQLISQGTLDFDIKGMFDAKLWSPTLEEFRGSKKKQEKIEPTENIKPVNNEGRKGFKIEELAGDKTDGSSPENEGNENEDPVKHSPEEIQTQKDFANLVVLISDMGVNFGIKAFTKYEVQEKDSDNAMRRKQLERSCIKIMNKYEFVPNVWTELLTVLSAYGLQKYSALEPKATRKKKLGRKTKKVDQENQSQAIERNINYMQRDNSTQPPEGPKEDRKPIQKDNIGIIDMLVG